MKGRPIFRESDAVKVQVRWGPCLDREEEAGKKARGGAQAGT